MQKYFLYARLLSRFKAKSEKIAEGGNWKQGSRHFEIPDDDANVTLVVIGCIKPNTLLVAKALKKE